MNKTAWIVLIAVLLTWFISRRYYTAVDPAPAGYVLDSVVTVYDTLTYLDTSRPILITAEPVAIPVIIDTAAIVKDYFTRKSYRDSLTVNDVRIQVDYSLLANSLESSSWQVTNLRPTIREFYSPKQYPNRIAAGLLMGRNLAAPMVSYTRNDLQLQVGYNLLQDPGGPVWLLGAQYTLFKF